MANRTAWTIGNNTAVVSAGGYTTLINSGDLTGLINGNTVLSSLATITNSTFLDQYMDISIQFTCASSTIGANAAFVFWIYYVNQNTTTYGDNQLPTPGTSATITPVFSSCATISIPAASGVTNMYGSYTGILLAPRDFRVACQNNSGVTLTGSPTCKYATYNMTLNN